jgi:puromycin-sensitive aminopeptidase
VTYATTPKMSTYLLAFAVGEYESVEDATKGGVTVRVWAPLGEAEQGRFALGVACQVLAFFLSSPSRARPRAPSFAP